MYRELCNLFYTSRRDRACQAYRRYQTGLNYAFPWAAMFLSLAFLGAADGEDLTNDRRLLLIFQQYGRRYHWFQSPNQQLLH